MTSGTSEISETSETAVSAVAPPLRFAHQPALDGLRALAVALVIAFHLGFGWIPAGFLGVDVFFVLSGFLITTLLLHEVAATGKVSLRAFWIRRARRLLPALLLVIPVSLAISLMLPAGQRSPTLAGDGLASLVYVANWRFVATGQNYFAVFGAPSPLQHLWSLAIEEQWYLVWPIVVAVALRRWRRFLIGSAIVAAIASAVAFVALADPPGSVSRAYYGTDTRVQALLVGAIAALILGRRVDDAGPRRDGVVASRTLHAWDLAGWLSVVALVAITVTTGESDRWLYRGGFTVVALLSLTMVLAAVRGPQTSYARAWSWRPLRFVGERAYALYLWHWPIVVFVHDGWMGQHGATVTAVRVVMIAIASMASHHLVEQPVRRMYLPRPAIVGFASVALLSSAVLVNAASAQTPDALTQTALTVPLSLTPLGDPAARPSVAPTSLTGPIDSGSPTSVATPSSSSAPQSQARQPWRIAVMGDSTALTLGVGWDPSIDTNTEAYGQASFGCGLADGFPVSKRTVIATDPACRDWSDQWISAIGRAGPRVVIVMAGAWEVLDHRLDKTTVRFGTSRWDDVVRAAFEKAVAAASSTDRPVALLTVPCYQQSTQSEQPALERNDPARVARANELLRSVAADHPNVTVIDYGAFVCPGGEYTEKLDGVSMRFDGVHLSADGARVTWEWLLPQLKKLDPDWFGP